MDNTDQNTPNHETPWGRQDCPRCEQPLDEVEGVFTLTLRDGSGVVADGLVTDDEKYKVFTCICGWLMAVQEIE